MLGDISKGLANFSLNESSLLFFDIESNYQVKLLSIPDSLSRATAGMRVMLILVVLNKSGSMSSISALILTERSPKGSKFFALAVSGMIIFSSSSSSYSSDSMSKLGINVETLKPDSGSSSASAIATSISWAFVSATSSSTTSSTYSVVSRVQTPER